MSIFEWFRSPKVEPEPIKPKREIKTRKAWTLKALAAQSLIQTGEVANFSAIYAGYSPAEKARRKHDIRLASSVHLLRKDGWKINTEINEHGTAVYKLVTPGTMPILPVSSSLLQD